MVLQLTAHRISNRHHVTMKAFLDWSVSQAVPLLRSRSVLDASDLSLCGERIFVTVTRRDVLSDSSTRLCGLPRCRNHGGGGGKIDDMRTFRLHVEDA